MPVAVAMAAVRSHFEMPVKHFELGDLPLLLLVHTHTHTHIATHRAR